MNEARSGSATLTADSDGSRIPGGLTAGPGRSLAAWAGRRYVMPATGYPCARRERF